MFARSKYIGNVAALLVAIVSLACGRASERPFLDLATTTSVQNAGLLDGILPAFEPATVRVHAAGSGRALAMLVDGIVDVVISHAPAAEAQLLAQHREWKYHKVAFNRFIVVGPSSDSAGVGHARHALDAFRRMAQADVPFISRGDGSGTHEREQALWKEAGTQPSPALLIVSGNSMATTLRHASERLAYTLSDEATFRQLQSSLNLVAFTVDDARLLNTYAVVYPTGNAVAQAFAAWLVQGAGREVMGAYRIGSLVPFTPWPDACPRLQPTDLPCQR